MKRHLKILEFALSSILRRKAKNVSLVVVYAFTVSVLASILLLTTSLKKEAAAVFADAPDLIVQRVIAGRHDLVPLDYIESIKKIPGVGEVAPRYWGYYYDGLTKSNYTMMSVAPDSTNFELLEGRLPLIDGECAIGAGVAEARRSKLGYDLILIDSTNLGVIYDVKGVFKHQSDLLTNDLVLFTEKDLKLFFNIPDNMATDLSVQIYNQNEVPTIAAKIQNILPGTRPITKQEILRTYDAVFNWRSGMMLTIFSGALVAFAILAWDKATGISSEEKREIGVLKAIGWDTSDVLELKFWEGFVLSLTSFLLGLIAAYVHIFFFNATILAQVLRGWSFLFPEFVLTPYVNLYQIFVIGFLTITPYIACTVIPSWKAAITDPEYVMRS